MAKTTNGSKIEESRYVFQATRFIYEGNSDSAVCKLLDERYGFDVSVPCVAAFRTHFYEKRLKEMVEFSAAFQKQQSGRIKTFIDESMEQAAALKKQLVELEKNEVVLNQEIAFCTKFDNVFKHAIDKYLENFDPQHPTEFLQNQTSTEEAILASAVASMGEDNRLALMRYIETHAPQHLYKLRTHLAEKLMNHREAIVHIHRDVFKSYRNYSILQELTLIFEEYNAIIIEEFFPDRNNIDREKYTKVKQRIMALYDKLQIRYQGVEGPSEGATKPQSAEAVAEGAVAAVKKLSKDGPKFKQSGPGRPPSKIRTIIRERERLTLESEVDSDEVEQTVQQVEAAIEKISEEQALRATDKLVEADAAEPPSTPQMSADLDNLIKRPDSPETTPSTSGLLPKDHTEPPVEELFGEETTPESQV